MDDITTGTQKFWDKQARSASDAAMDGGHQADSVVLLGASEAVINYRDRCEKRLFSKVIPLDASMQVLDVGCGTGRWTVYLAQHCRKIVAFDFSRGLLKIAERRLKSAGIRNASLVHSSLDRFHTDERFHLAVISSVLVCASDADVVALIKTLASLLLPGGRVFSLEFTGIRRNYMGAEKPEYRMRTREELVQLFGAEGLILEDEGYAFPPVVVPILLHRILIPKRWQESPIVQRMLRGGLWVQYRILDPMLSRAHWLYKPLLSLKRRYPVHHRWYLYTKIPGDTDAPSQAF
jgi:2-polyprenyl-3-methyl-5-hydroxy-6-metoxy-1,4-benzoquinol methylase